VGDSRALLATTVNGSGVHGENRAQFFVGARRPSNWLLPL